LDYIEIERRSGMRRTKRMMVGVWVLALLMSFSIAAPAFAAENFTVHAKAPVAWTTPGLWAWSAPDGTNVFSAWPGQPLTKDEANEGWYYYEIPDWANSIIINEGVEGGGQTADVSIEARELWITVADDFSATVVYQAPEGFAAAAETTETAAPAADVPKTGAISYAGAWLGAAALSGLGLVALRRKRAA
jgi:LPXTG-motif cell wall-anchored protein